MAWFPNKKQLLGLVFAAFLGAFLAQIPSIDASFLPLPDGTDLNVPKPEGETAIQKLEDILGPIGRNLRIIVGAIAVFLIVISGFIMVVGGENEETVKNQKKSMTFGIIGLMMISIAGPLAEIFDFRQGNLLEDPESFVDRAELFDSTTRIVITFIKYVLGAYATLMMIRAGAVMITSGHNEEEVTREKKNLGLSAAGLLMVIVSDLVVRRILFDAEYNDYRSETVVAIHQNEFILQLAAVVNLIVSFVGPVMMLGLVIGGVLYVTAGGDEERVGLAKKILLNSVIGVIIIYGAFALVSTVIAGVF